MLDSPVDDGYQRTVGYSIEISDISTTWMKFRSGKTTLDTVVTVKFEGEPLG
jgi:hypothetical protein